MSAQLSERRAPPTDEQSPATRVPPVARAPLLAPKPLPAVAKPGAGDAASLVVVQSAVLAETSLAGAARALADAVAGTLGATRVSVGLRAGDRNELVGISHGAELDAEGETALARLAAMDEALDQARAIDYPVADDAISLIRVAHAELATQGAVHAVSVPMIRAGRVLGVLTCECATRALTAGEIAWCERVACLCGPVLELARRAERPWWAVVREHPRPRRGAMVAAMLAGAFALANLPVAHHVGAPARLEGLVERAVVAPADGFLERVHVAPGDRVEAGQVVAELATSDLALERDKWLSAMTQHENAYGAALARGDRAEFAINQARADEARAELDRIEQQLSRTQLLAPLSGIVIEGDLRDNAGAPVTLGEELLVIAPADGFRLMIEVDERDIEGVRAGQHGRLALAGLPGEILDFTVARVTPVATVRDGRNTFLVEATLEAAAALRPGMQGVAKIEAGDRALAWRLTRRVVDAARLALWSWSP